MKVWKLMALMVAGGLVLQAASCITDFAYLILQGVATQLASGVVTSALGAATGTTG